MSGYEVASSHAAWLDAGSRGRLLVTGEDAGRLLHALSSNDVKGLADRHGVYAFFLTAQGRILADANIFRAREKYVLDTEPELKTKLREHIDAYIIADDAEVACLDGWGEISVEGPMAAETARSIGLPVSEERFGLRDWGGGFTARIGLCTTNGVRVIAPQAEIAGIADQLKIPKLTPEEARILRIESGIPRYGEDITERYLVQETGQLHGVHFSKGCYLGQEIVERVRSRAQVHRHLHSLRIAGDEAPQPGTKLKRAEADAGEITSAVYSPRLGEIAALGYVRTEVLNDRPELTANGLVARLTRE